MISTRRHALTRMAAGFGSVGLAGLLANDNPPHFAPKAKRIIYLVLNGGLSQIDSFDPKPLVDKYDGQAMPGVLPKTESSLGHLMRSPFALRLCPPRPKRHSRQRDLPAHRRAH